MLCWFLLYDEVKVICIHVSFLSWASLLSPSHLSWLCILETIDLVLCTLISLETQQIVYRKKQLCVWDLSNFPYCTLYPHDCQQFFPLYPVNISHEPMVFNSINLSIVQNQPLSPRCSFISVPPPYRQFLTTFHIRTFSLG